MSETPGAQAAPQPPAAPRVSKWRRRMKWIGVLLLVFVFLGGAAAVTMEHYTSQPQFCGSCHIMEPYYQSWEQDVHATKASARCVDCHYAPGEQHTLMAKFRGLSQLASYFSGRAGAGRPKAHVNDASCLTSGCHGDNKFMNVELKIGTVTFVHAKHMDPEGKIATEKRKETADLRSKLVQSIGAERVTALERLSQPIEHALDRNKRLAEWLGNDVPAELRSDVFRYGELLHTEVRLSQLDGMKCASCHQFNSTLATHVGSAMTTCYTCHFMNEPFNEGSGRCLTCHEPPKGDVAVHAGEGAGMHRVATTTSPAVTMNHAVIVEQNVNCISCHSDLIHGSGKVSIRDCQNCHDQDRYLRNFDNRTTETVREYHRLHAAAQRARCNDCHQLIEHKLTPVAAPDDAVALLAPVRQDCQHCHPDHHREQVELLLGRGGHVEGAQGVPNPMTGSRANCQACHTKVGEDPKQEAVIVGTLESCRGCHGAEYEQLFTRWKDAIQARQDEAAGLLERAEQRRAAVQMHDEAWTEAGRLLDRARENIRLVRTANGMHNKNYALMLLDQAIADVERAQERLGGRAGTRPSATRNAGAP